MASTPKRPLAKRANESRLTATRRGKEYGGALQVVCVAGLVAALFYFGGVKGDVKMMAVASTALTVFFVLLRFDSIKKLKAFKGLFEMEGALRRAEEVTDEAKATVDQLRRVGLTLAKPSLRLVAVSGRFGGGIPMAERIETVDDVVDALRLAGCDDDDLNGLRTGIDKVTRFDLAARVFRLVMIAVNNDAVVEKKRKEMIGLDPKGSWIKGREFSSPTPKDLRALLAEHDVTDTRVLRRVEEYERFCEERKVPSLVRDDEEEQELKKEREAAKKSS